MTGIQSPQILTDLYRDLRDRRLLPLVVVLVVGLAVVPIALSSKSAPQPAPPPPPASEVADRSNVPATEVVISDPGLRDYRRRLEGDDPKDPFTALFIDPAASEAEGAADQGASSATAPGGAGSGTSGAALGDTGGAAAGGGETTVRTVVQTDTKVVVYRLKLRTGEVGGKMTTMDEVGPSAQLPSKKVPAMVFLGANFDGDLEAQRAYFMVSNGVSAISGDGRCELGDPCQLVSVKPGQHVDLVWTDGRQYRVTLVAFRRHVRDQVPAQLGDFGGGGNGGGGESRKSSP